MTRLACGLRLTAAYSVILAATGCAFLWSAVETAAGGLRVLADWFRPYRWGDRRRLVRDFADEIGALAHRLDRRWSGE